MAYQQKVTPSRFGDYVLKFAETVVNKKSGEVIENVFKTYFECGGKLIKVEISPATKEGKRGNGGVWVKFTKVDKQQQRRSTSF